MVGDVQDLALDELDERLVHAIQISPRASWSALAPIVGADAVTLARHWERLQSKGLVYVTGHREAPVNVTMAFVELECAPGESVSLARELAEDSEAFTVELTAGGRNVLLALSVPDFKALSEWTLDRVQALTKIRSMRTHLVAATITDARAWRLRALSTEEAKAVTALDKDVATRSPRLSPEQDVALMGILGQDGRASTSAISAQTGIPQRKVREAIAAMRAEGRLILRLDIARSLTSWPILAWYFLHVPGSMVEKVGIQLSRMAEVRYLASTVGPYSMLMAVWLRNLSEVQRLEAAIEDRIPGVVIADRSVVLRTAKHLGRLLDDNGLATDRTVPMSRVGSDLHRRPLMQDSGLPSQIDSP